MRKIKKLYLALCAAVLMFAWVGISLAAGIPPITAGDKYFDQWWALVDSGPTVTANGVIALNITPLNDGGTDPGPGLQYNFNPYLTPFDSEPLDLYLGFRVTTLSNQLIKDNSLYLDTYSGYNISIREMITDIPIDNSNPQTIQDTFNQIGRFQGTYLGFKEVYSMMFPNPGLYEQTYDSANFSPRDEIYVATWIHLQGGFNGVGITPLGFNGLGPQLTQFTQRFSQTPEPTTMLLLGTGLVGIAGAARRKKKNQA